MSESTAADPGVRPVAAVAVGEAVAAINDDLTPLGLVRLGFGTPGERLVEVEASDKRATAVTNLMVQRLWPASYKK